jgi:hypothetical protein
MPCLSDYERVIEGREWGIDTEKEKEAVVM